MLVSNVEMNDHNDNYSNNYDDDNHYHEHHGYHDYGDGLLNNASESNLSFSISNENIYGDLPGFVPSKAMAFLGNLWDSFAKPPNERRFIRKLDGHILVYALLSYGLKALDSSNVSNAYVSGMEEELNLQGQERNLFHSFYFVGYLIGSTPSQVIINRIRPSIWIPACELIWSFLVVLLALVTSAKQIYVIRLLLGLFESSSYPGFAYILGSWYGPDELAKRMGVYDCAGYVARVLSGLIQAAAYAALNGVGGIAGWRWMFVVDGVIGVPIALWGFSAIPDFPTTTRASWLDEHERAVSIIRMQSLGKKEPRRLTFRRFYDMFCCSWRPWPFLVSYTMLWISGTTMYFNLWLKSLNRFSVEQINMIPSIGYAIGFISAYLFANFSDRTQARWPWLFLATLFRFTGSVLLAIWYLPVWVIFLANMLSYLGEPVWSLLITWAAEAFQDDAELRGLLTAVGNTLGSAFILWLPLVLFPTYEAPHYKIGYIATSIFDVVDFAALMVFLFCINREKKMRNQKLRGLASMDGENIELYKLEVQQARDDVELVQGEMKAMLHNAEDEIMV
ncbi:major facilitator superfamily domain-containing protein [Lipomyces oligophaga]|uniref:major facilitator superfamily domain-containing protein n=1 Tax=Lipomyces oligophaga TaxID=45792 RepID=UPI0034CD48B7